MIEIKDKLTKVGNSYYLRIPKPLIDCKVIDPNKQMVIQVIPKDLKDEEGNKLHNGALVLPTFIISLSRNDYIKAFDK